MPAVTNLDSECHNIAEIPLPSEILDSQTGQTSRLEERIDILYEPLLT
jgi:hypothetical protein